MDLRIDVNTSTSLSSSSQKKDTKLSNSFDFNNICTLNTKTLLRRLSHLTSDGSSSTVFRSFHCQSLTLVAEKEVKVNDIEIQNQLYREIRTLKGLLSNSITDDNDNNISNHDGKKHIVDLIDIINNPTSNTISLCLEYMHASLQDLMNCGGCTHEEVLSGISLQVLKGLDYLHSNHYMHRDIKPANILINTNGIVKLGDFGLCYKFSRNDGKQSVTDSFTGTYTYMSPERLEGQSYTYSSDIWSTGLTILAVALGEHPFKSQVRRSCNDEGYWKILADINNSFTGNGPLFQRASKENNHNHNNGGGGIDDQFLKFINSCCMKDSNLRPTAKELLNHQFVMKKSDDDDEDGNWLRRSLHNLKSVKQKQQQQQQQLQQRKSIFVNDYDPSEMKLITNFLDEHIDQIMNMFCNDQSHLSDLITLLNIIQDNKSITKLSNDLQISEKKLKIQLLQPLLKLKELLNNVL